MLPNDAVWFITGTSTGLGAALAHAIISSPLFTSSTSQHRLVATALTLSTLTHLPQSHPRILLLELDVTSANSINTAVEATVRHFGTIDVLINNAGINTFASAETLPLGKAHEIMDTNFWGPVQLTRAILPIMRRNAKQRESLIVMVSSIGGRIGAAAHAAYCASKWAVQGWMESLRAEVEDEWGLDLCLLEVGGVKSEYAKKSGERGGFEIAQGAYGEGSKVAKMIEIIGNPEVQKGWMNAEAVAKRVVEVLGGKGEVPFRMVLGEDALQAISSVDEERKKEMRNWMK